MAERSATDDRTNPRPTRLDAAERSVLDRQTNPKPAARMGMPERSATDDRTKPAPAARTGVAERSVANNQMNPRPAARSGVAEPSASDDRTNPKPGAIPRTHDATRDRGAIRRGRMRQTERTREPAAATAAAAPARLHYDDAYISGILQRVRTIAAVGMSANDMRPSYFAMLYLQQKGYRMIPVNPRYAGQQILGETVVASLDDLPAPPDMVQVFRKAEEAPAVVDEAIRAGAKVVWLQLGIRSEEAAAKARAAGLDVVMDRCPKIEYGRLFGEIGWAGVNRRVISAKKGQALQLSHKKGGLAGRPTARG